MALRVDEWFCAAGPCCSALCVCRTIIVAWYNYLAEGSRSAQYIYQCLCLYEINFCGILTFSSGSLTNESRAKKVACNADTRARAVQAGVVDADGSCACSSVDTRARAVQVVVVESSMVVESVETLANEVVIQFVCF